MKAFTFLARRFVAGAGPHAAARAGARLHGRGNRAPFAKDCEDGTRPVAE